VINDVQGSLKVLQWVAAAAGANIVTKYVLGPMYRPLTDTTVQPQQWTAAFNCCVAGVIIELAFPEGACCIVCACNQLTCLEM